METLTARGHPAQLWMLRIAAAAVPCGLPYLADVYEILRATKPAVFDDRSRL
jgi:hypothetical protein